VTQGSTQDAIALAKARWASLHPFDLEDATWETLFAQHLPGTVLEAVKKTKATIDPRPERIYSSLLYWITRIENPQKMAALWPLPDVHKN